MLGIPGMRSDDACLVAALDVKMLSSFEFLLAQRQELETRLSVHCFTATAVLLLYTGFATPALSCALRVNGNNPPLFLIALCAYDNTLWG